MAVIAGTIIGIMFGSAATAQAQIPHINIEQVGPRAASSMSKSVPASIFLSMDGRPSKSSDDPSPRLLARAHSNASTCKFLSTSSKVQPNVSCWWTAAWIRS
jgi:hypothetical protein